VEGSQARIDFRGVGVGPLRVVKGRFSAYGGPGLATPSRQQWLYMETPITPVGTPGRPPPGGIFRPAARPRSPMRNDTRLKAKM